MYKNICNKQCGYYTRGRPVNHQISGLTIELTLTPLGNEDAWNLKHHILCFNFYEGPWVSHMMMYNIHAFSGGSCFICVTALL